MATPWVHTYLKTNDEEELLCGGELCPGISSNFQLLGVPLVDAAA